jgi:glycosyltransferase involved in cell wall biosynthesis
VTGAGLAPVPSDLSGARIAVANWRDPWHPQAGGAERYAWEIARGLVARGAAVTYLTARAPGQDAGEKRDGIEIIRLGGRFTVYPLVLRWLLAHRRFFHAVLDCQNGIPFFAPCVLPRRVPVLCVVHHVHSAQFSVHFPWWMAWAGRLLEGPVARVVYRRHACVAVSPSTVAAMRERLRWTGDIYMIPNGAPVPPPQASKPYPAGPFGAVPYGSGVGATGAGRLVWVGRLVAHKRAELILPVAERLRGHGVTIEVVGRGPAEESLADLVAARGLGDTIRLHGFLPEASKQTLVGGSLLHLNTSQGEGWGLSVLEAAALGVPTVAYDVDGLRDAVRDGQTGWLVRQGELFEDVVQRAVKELSDPSRRAAMAAACREWASRLDWDDSAERMAALIRASIVRGTSRGSRRGAWVLTYADVAGPGAAGSGTGGPGTGGTGTGDRREVLAEGPVLDFLIKKGADVATFRPAMPLERLLGRAAGESGLPQ